MLYIKYTTRQINLQSRDYTCGVRKLIPITAISHSFIHYQIQFERTLGELSTTNERN